MTDLIDAIVDEVAPSKLRRNSRVVCMHLGSCTPRPKGGGCRPTVKGKRTYGGWPGQRVEEQGTWAAQKHSEAGYGRPVDRGVWTAKTVKRPRQQPAHPQYANYWAPLTRKRHTMPHSAQPQHTNYWAPRTRKRHQQEHWPQRRTESSDPTQHAKGRTGDRPGPRKGATTRRNVTQGVQYVERGGGHSTPRVPISAQHASCRLNSGHSAAPPPTERRWGRRARPRGGSLSGTTSRWTATRCRAGRS